MIECNDLKQIQEIEDRWENDTSSMKTTKNMDG